ncbi:unnamed protein product [Trifolium pratense]|uniref:Uncharacterized protein n=1 Tax=Trifolium pratense TaxID=57577 RepID=A0ACB0KKA0_TRIPR|nr:unnamed protein product [Trifolium pratense]
MEKENQFVGLENTDDSLLWEIDNRSYDELLKKFNERENQLGNVREELKLKEEEVHKQKELSEEEIFKMKIQIEERENQLANVREELKLKEEELQKKNVELDNKVANMAEKLEVANEQLKISKDEIAIVRKELGSKSFKSRELQDQLKVTQENMVKLECEITMSNSDNTVDVTVQPFVVVNDHVAPSDKSISDSVVELVTFSIKENITTLDVAQDVGTSSVQPNPNATTITESFGDSCDFEAATGDELQDKENNDIPADVIEDSKTEESIEKVVSLDDKDTESEKTVYEEQEMIDLDELEEAALEATDAGVDENLSVDAGGDN